MVISKLRMEVEKLTAESTGDDFIVCGYHGTTLARADAILENGQFQLSQNPWDWLGDGVYFWQDAPIGPVIAEGEPLFAGSLIRRRSHVQIAVRDPKLIDAIEMV